MGKIDPMTYSELLSCITARPDVFSKEDRNIAAFEMERAV